ncbi:MAG: DNA polymerase III subunit chi [Pseudomonadota bacterium]
MGLIAELLFYHLERDPLDRVLPQLVARSLERSWRCLVRVTHGERAEALDRLLWSWRDDSFLPHGLATAPHADRQPVLISESADNLNGANVLFSVDGAAIDDAGAYDRTVYLFDGHDTEAVANARTVWRWGKEQSLELTYWQQSDAGQWQKRA